MTENTLVERIVEKIAADLMDRVEDDGYCLHKDSIKDVCRKVLSVEIVGGTLRPSNPYMERIEAEKASQVKLAEEMKRYRATIGQGVVLAPGCGSAGDSIMTATEIVKRQEEFDQKYREKEAKLLQPMLDATLASVSAVTGCNLLPNEAWKRLLEREGKLLADDRKIRAHYFGKNGV
jgi:hypothetical protein